MKQAVNFRLSNHATAILALLVAKLNTSKTAVVEEALDVYAEKKMAEHPLLKYVGVLNDEDADEMLTAIKSSRKNKTREIKW